MAALKILLTQLVLCALLGVIVINGKPPSAVLDGDLADDNEFPYLVSLSILGNLECGGSIIDSRHILTAAHCIENVDFAINYMTVTAGTKYFKYNEGDRYRIKNVTIHPRFLNSKNDSWRNDIAVITLRSEIELDDRHRPVNLPTSDVPPITWVKLYGWGDTTYPNGMTPSRLRKLSMLVIPNSACTLAGIPNIAESHICVYSRKGAGACLGDSGGPILVNGTVFGISSFIAPCAKDYPDVFTRVHSYVDWIKEVTEIY